MKELCDTVRNTAYAIHVYHGHGHLEKVYENALVHRLRKAGLEVKQQHQINVYDEDGTPIGEYFADLFVDGRLIVELKACRTTAAEHVAQILGYLKSARIEDGMLINFGSYKFELNKYAMSRNRARALSSLRLLFYAFFAFFCGKISVFAITS
jgi:GxxExxY protein